MTPSHPSKTEPELLSVPEAAERLKISGQAVRNWVRGGKLRGHKSGYGVRSYWKIERKSVEELIRNSRLIVK